MKKLLAVTLLVLLCIAATNWFGAGWSNDWHVYAGGDEIGGPLGFVLGTLLAGGGLVVGAVVIVCVALLVGLVCAGLGMVAVVGLAALAAALVLGLAAALAPLLLPLAMLAGICWFFSRRTARRRARQAAPKEAAV